MSKMFLNFFKSFSDVITYRLFQNTVKKVKYALIVGKICIQISAFLKAYFKNRKLLFHIFSWVFYRNIFFIKCSLLEILLMLEIKWSAFVQTICKLYLCVTTERKKSITSRNWNPCWIIFLTSFKCFFFHHFYLDSSGVFCQKFWNRYNMKSHRNGNQR